MGPAVKSFEAKLALIDAGMNVARLNFSHGTHDEHKETIDLLKRARELRKVPLAIMLDTRGPEVRLGDIFNDNVVLNKGDEIALVREISNNPKQLTVDPGLALDVLEVGHKILFDDGYIIAHVIAKDSKKVMVKIENGGVLKSHKKINIPHVEVPLPAMTDKDIEDIKFGCQEDVDYIAASFIRSAEHIGEIRRLLFQQNKSDIKIIAKIENSLGVKNFDSILQVADGIMVARGDLGVELPIEEVPVLQKMMIRKSLQAFKPVVTATQMLESMIKNPRPTRAEASDVANAIYDSTSAVMLSGETAVGSYPIETVNLMCKIVEEAEKNFPYHEFFERDSRVAFHDVSCSISLASVKTAYSLQAKAIFAYTTKGITARLISRFRPEMPIIALTCNEKTYHQLAFNWGVIPIPPTSAENMQEAFVITSDFVRERQLVEYGDLVVITAGAPFGVSGTTNMMLVESIGEVLVRGNAGEGKEIQGKVAIVLSADFDPEMAKDRIIVLSKYEESFYPILKKAKAIILQNHPDDLHSEELAQIAAKKAGIPLVKRADGAMQRLQDGQRVILNPEKGIVYKGSMVTESDDPGISEA